MRSKIKASKISGVIFLTVLIWVWADLALERPLPLTSQPIRMAASTDPALAMAFESDGNYATTAMLNRLILIGPEATIRNVDRIPRDKLEFVLEPEALGLTQEGTHTVPLLNFLRQAVGRESRLAGLTVESCEPVNVTVRVQRLTRIKVRVQSVDQDNLPIEGATIDPAEVDMFIPEEWGADRRVASVVLAPAEIDRARLNPSPVTKKPFVMVLGQRREAETSVRISTPDIEGQLESGAITIPKLGFVLSTTLQSKYTVVMDEANLNSAVGLIRLRATVDARLAYEKSLYHVLLEVEDKDAEVGEIIRRLRYNFPPEFAGTGQIRLDQDPVSVTFKLVPNAPNGSETPAVD